MPDTTIEHFMNEGLIDGVIRPLKHGKEASVHLVRANPRTTGHELAALKVYHPLNQRDFRDEALYRDGEFIKERRVRVALAQKTKFGREVQGSLWVDREWETLRQLDTSGVPVPRPIAVTEDAILMTYIGNVDRAAPRLHETRPDSTNQLETLWEQIYRAVEYMLYHDIVHADLSAYNLLVWDDSVTVIDFPQAVDPKKNRHAEEFLRRDIQRVGGWFERHGFDRPWETLAEDLWASWLHADLLPTELQFYRR